MTTWINIHFTKPRPRLGIKWTVPQADRLLNCILSKFLIRSHSLVMVLEKTIKKDKREGISKQTFGISSDAPQLEIILKIKIIKKYIKIIIKKKGIDRHEELPWCFIQTLSNHQASSIYTNSVWSNVLWDLRGREKKLLQQVVNEGKWVINAIHFNSW